MNSSSTPVYRAAHVSESAAIASASRLHVEYGLRWRWTPARVRQEILHPDSMVLVATVRGNLAGFAIMHFGEQRAHLQLLAVLPPYRRAGIGTALLAWLEKSCVTAGIQQIRLEVRSANCAGIWGNLGTEFGDSYLNSISASLFPDETVRELR